MADEPRSQDWRFTMWVFTSVLFVDLLAQGHMAAFTPLYLEQELGVPPEQVPIWAGILAAAPLAIAVPFSPFWGVLAERYSRKAIIVRAEFAAALGYLIAALALGPWGLLLSRIAFGFSYGHVAVMLATQSMITPGRRLGNTLGIIQAAMPAATAASPLWGALLVQTVGLRWLWAFDSVAVLCGGIAMLLVLREPDVPRDPTPVLARVREMASITLRVPTVRWSFVAWFVVFAGAGAADPFVPVLIRSLYAGPNPAVVIGIVLGAYGVATSLGTIAVGQLADRAGPTRVLIVSCGMLSLVVGAMAFAPTLLVLGALILLRALPQAGTGPSLYLHLANVLPPSHRAPIMGFTPFPRNLAYLIAPLVGAVASGFSLEMVFLISAACFATGIVVARLLDRAPAFATGTVAS